MFNVVAAYFNLPYRERNLITKIAERAREIDAQVNPDLRRRSMLQWQLDIAACHANACALDLERLEGFDAFNFCHDVFGIARHLDRKNSTLKDCFTPRAAR